MKIKYITFIILSAVSLQAFSGYPADTTKNSLLLEPYHKNIIKFNPTPMLVFSEIRNITLGYERLINKNQSVAFQAGYLTFPDIFKDTIAKIVKFTGNTNQQGINLAFDYRYYPLIRNRRPAPDGVYIGAYISYFGFQLDNYADILRTEIEKNIEFQGRADILNMGFDIGYQFVFWKKLTFDLLVFGPSLNLTRGKGEIKGDLNQDEINAIDEEMQDILIDNFPLLAEVFSEGSLTFSGSHTDFGMGFRYALQIGFHF